MLVLWGRLGACEGGCIQRIYGITGAETKRGDWSAASLLLNNSIGRESPEGGACERRYVRVCFEHALKCHSAPVCVYVPVLLYNRAWKSVPLAFFSSYVSPFCQKTPSCRRCLLRESRCFCTDPQWSTTEHKGKLQKRRTTVFFFPERWAITTECILWRKWCAWKCKYIFSSCQL